MAISQTMSNPNYDPWSIQMYQATNFSDISQIEAPPTSATASAGSSRNNSLSPDQGRVANPIRRRLRASRRAPTTLINTDTANFRAMVQQFTGGPSARSQLPGGGGAAAVSFSVTGGDNSIMAVQQPNEFQLMQQQHVFMMNDLHGGNGGTGGRLPSYQASSRGNGVQNYNNFML